MALQVWLPLIKPTIENQGLFDIEPITINGADNTVENVGKLGSVTQFTDAVFKQPLNENIKEFSICAWVKIDSVESNHTIFSARTQTGKGIAIFILSSTGKIRFDDGSQYTFQYALPVDKWTHVCLTRSKTSKNLYINGELKETTSTVGDLSSIYNIGSIKSSSVNGTTLANTMSGHMNDFRIYDHCLSVKEIKEISKGLVCHYKLSNRYEMGLQNKYSAPYSDGYITTITNFVRTKLEDERGYNYKLSYTGTGSNKWMSLQLPTFSFIAGKKYYYSCKIRCHSTNGVTLALRAARTSNDWNTNMTSNVLIADSEWHEYVTYQTIDTTFDRNGSTITSTPLFEMYSNSLTTADKVYSADFDIKDIQVIESDEYVPFIENSLSSSEVCDNSGNGYNAEVNNLAYTGDSPRYDGCYKFNGDTSIVKISNFDITSILSNDFTISFWLYNNDSGSRSVYFGNHNFGTGFCFSLEKTTAEKLRIYWYGSPDIVVNSFNIPDKQWCHIVIVKTGSTFSVYLNGTIKHSESYTLQAISNCITTFGIGRDNRTGTTALNGCMSDFRLYSTALSANDIKELYQSPISLDNHSNLFGYEFKEV